MAHLNDTEPEQAALFQIEGPDEDGCVWACSTEGRDVWCANLGPAAKVAEVMSQWLGSIDYDEVEDFEATARRLGAAENEKRESKRLRKAARPTDHRDEGGQG